MEKPFGAALSSVAEFELKPYEIKTFIVHLQV